MACALFQKRAHLPQESLGYWRGRLGERHSCFNKRPAVRGPERPGDKREAFAPGLSRVVVGDVRVVQHVLAEIALPAIGARVGVIALDVAVLAAGDVFR
jgi:hypothetical protein